MAASIAAQNFGMNTADSRESTISSLRPNLQGKPVCVLAAQHGLGMGKPVGLLSRHAGGVIASIERMVRTGLMTRNNFQ
jgi:hypothetical protein